MSEEELKEQVAKLDREIAHWAQQVEQMKANWNYVRGIRAAYGEMLAKVQTSVQAAENMVKSTENRSQLGGAGDNN